MKSESPIKVVIQGSPSTHADYLQAMRAPSAQLPALNAEDREMAKRFGASEEEYARSIFLTEIGRQRWERKAEKLSTLLRSGLQDVDGHKPERLISLLWDQAHACWRIRFEGVAELTVNWRQVDEWLEMDEHQAVSQIVDRLNDLTRPVLPAASHPPLVREHL